MRAVLDTNVLVSALLFRGEASKLRVHWHARRLVLVASREMMAELVRVLAYPKFKLAIDTVNALLAAEVLPFVEVTNVERGTPTCRDPDDDPFVWCAVESRSDALISGDADVLALRPAVSGVAVLTVTEALARLAASAAG
jgi:putative PIN family toxin of toxin-antitoxin system